MNIFEPLDFSPADRIPWGDLRPDLIARFRKFRLANGDHATEALSDPALLLQAGLALSERDSEDIFPTLSSLLLLGTDQAIRARFPRHVTVAIHKDTKGSEVREEIRTNLLETHDHLMAFVRRLLPTHSANGAGQAPRIVSDTPEETGDDVRDLVFGELFANSLVFRSYSKIHMARFTIEPRRVALEYGQGLHKEANLLAPLSNLLLPLLRRDSAASPLSKWSKRYFGLAPLVIEGSLFRFVVPFPKLDLTQTRAAHATWDIPDSPAFQTPWSNSTAAQAEIAHTRSVIAELKGIPVLEEVEPEELSLTTMQPDFSPTGQQLATETLPGTLHATVLSSSPRAHATVQEIILPMQDPAEKEEFPGVQKEAGESPSSDVLPGKLKSAKSTHMTVQAERTARILEFCRIPRDRSDIQAHIGIHNRDYFRKDILIPLIESGRLAPTLPDKPNSPHQQYRTLPVS